MAGAAIRIAYRRPYDWDAMMAFLAARATPGVEEVDHNRYRRTISFNDGPLSGTSGTIAVTSSADEPVLLLDVRVNHTPAIPVIVEQVGRMFDTALDPALLGAALQRDPLLEKPLTAHPGIRKPGAWDPFELSVRAILGQQISVAAATTIAGRVATRWGTPIDGGSLSRLFPTPAQLAAAPLEDAGIIRSRATTLRALACAVRDGTVRFDGGHTREQLLALRGIGEWTAQYIAMRALNEPDAFPSGDLVLRKMAGDCSARELDRHAEAWRPWRAYAVMLLWQAARDAATPRKAG